MKLYKGKSIKELLKSLFARLSWGNIENIMSCHWINPFATLYLNFRSIRFAQALKLPILVYGRPKFYNLSGSIIIEGKTRFGMIKFNRTISGAPSFMGVNSEINNRGKIIFKGCGLIGCGTKICVGYGARLEIGDKFKITDFVNLGCYAEIIIGNQSWIVHRCQIFDSNYHYVADLKRREVPDYRKRIIIGNNCWVCNSSTICGGTMLPDYTIVGSNSLVNKDFSTVPPNSLIAGIPARFIKDGLVKINNQCLIDQIDRYFAMGATSAPIYNIEPSISISTLSYEAD